MRRRTKQQLERLQMDDAVAEAWRETLLPGYLLQGTDYTCYKVEATTGYFDLPVVLVDVIVLYIDETSTLSRTSLNFIRLFPYL